MPLERLELSTFCLREATRQMHYPCAKEALLENGHIHLSDMNAYQSNGFRDERRKAVYAEPSVRGE